MAERRKLGHQGRQMRLQIRTTADPQRVWEAWADPEKISQWFTDRARGEARPGATVTWIFEKFGYEIPYEVKDAVPGERFAIGGQLPDRPPFLLEVTIEREGGETVVTLVNSGFLEGNQWDEEYAVVELKGFAMGQAGSPVPVQRMIGVRVTAWGPEGERVQKLEPELNAALERLAAALAS